MKKSIKDFAKQSLNTSEQIQLKGGCCPTPTPYAGTGGSSGTKKVTLDKSSTTLGSTTRTSTGDEAGTAGGLKSHKIS
ncbi:hypothetical protein BKI52_20950 [marine bacterium AO1-C]|nr:hypothetical protein BKI52_20950 [marine bacterium AO1-C]